MMNKEKIRDREIGLLKERIKELSKTNEKLQQEIYDREKRERKLQDTLFEIKEMEMIVNKSPVVVFLWRAEEGWPVEYVSENIDQYGYNADDFISGRIPYAQFVYDQDLERVAEEVKKYSKEGVAEFAQEYRVVTRDGEVRWTDDRTWIRRDEKGKITHYQGIILDNTEVKTAVEQVQQFGKILEKSQNEIYIFDVNTFKFIHVNHGVVQNLGYSLEELKILTPVDIKPEYTVESFKKLVEPLLSGEKAKIQFITKHCRKDGTQYPVEVHLQLSTFESKHVFLSVILDITERKQAEKALRELSLRNEAILSAVPDIIMEVDVNKIYTWANKPGIEFFGDDVVGKEAVFYFEGEQETYDVVQPLFKGSGELIYLESLQRRKDGKKRLLSWWCRTLKDAEGNVTGALSTARDITEQKQAENELKDRKQFIESLVNLSPDILYIYDIVEGKNVYSNNGIQKVLGYTAEEIRGMSDKLLVTLMHPDDFKMYLEETYPKYLKIKDNEFVIHQYRMKHKSGDWCWLDCIEIIYMREPDGKPRQIFGVVHDITERKRADAALKESEERYRKLIETSPDGIAVTNLDGKFSFVNQKAVDLHGFDSAEELIGKSSVKFVAPEDRTLLLKHAKDALESHRAYNFEHTLLRRDGSSFPAEANATAMFDLEGKPVAFLTIFRDISERKQAENILKKNLKEITALKNITLNLSRSQSKQRVVKAVLNGVTEIIDPDLSLIFLRDEDRLILQNYKPKNSNYSHDKTPEHKVGECLCGLAVSGKKPLYSLDIHKDNRCTWSECKKAGLRSFAALPLQIGDKPIGVLGVASAKTRDFRKESIFLETLSNEVAIGLQNAMLYEKVQSHAVELEHTVSERTKELRKAVMRLQDLDKLKSIFLASMSHELRTPLNSIIGFTGILLMGMAGELNEEQKKQLEKVKNSASHLLNLINDILDISKIEAGKVEVYIEEINLKDIIKGVVDNIAPIVKEANLEIKYSVPNNIIIESDERRLKQVLMNLVSNAVKYTDKGNIIIQASLLKEQKVKIKVVDTGIGMPKKSLDKLFQPFQQISSSLTKKRGGTGLGLYLSKKLVALLGGSIMVKSEYRKGSEFSFVLPLKYKEKNK